MYVLYIINSTQVILCRVLACIVNSVGIYDIVYEKGNQSCCTGTWAFDAFNLKKWGSYLERLDEELIERSGTWYTSSIEVCMHAFIMCSLIVTFFIIILPISSHSIQNPSVMYVPFILNST